MPGSEKARLLQGSREMWSHTHEHQHHLFVPVFWASDISFYAVTSDLSSIDLGLGSPRSVYMPRAALCRRAQSESSMGLGDGNFSESTTLVLMRHPSPPRLASFGSTAEAEYLEKLCMAVFMIVKSIVLRSVLTNPRSGSS